MMGYSFLEHYEFYLIVIAIGVLLFTDGLRSVLFIGGGLFYCWVLVQEGAGLQYV